MRIVSYARVSTLAQESEGQSLANQERSISRWVEQSGAIRVRAYREAASAGSIAGRAEFTRMIDELELTKPDAIVVDTLDRFTRDATDGLLMLRQLRGHRVGLIPLDWRRDRPIDLDDDRDWQDVYDEFGAAERERRRIRRRVNRAYEGRRERGATTTNKPPFGLLKRGDQLVPDPDRVWIVAEVERRVLAGEAYGDIAAWARAVDAAAWKTRVGPALVIKNRSYVVAGVRTPERQAELDAITEKLHLRFGRVKHQHEHEFAGVFVCGLCVDQGYPPDRSIMFGGWQKGIERIICAHPQNRDPRGHTFYCDSRLVAPLWRRYVDELVQDEQLVDRWAHGGEPARDRRILERRLADLDQRAADLAQRRDRALDLLTDKSPAVMRQVRRLLTDVDTDEKALAFARDTVLSELSEPTTPKRDPELLRTLFRRFVEIYDRASLRDRNALARAIVGVVGHPQLRRIGAGGRAQRYDVALSWPGVDEFSRASKTRSERARSSSLR
jgi:DNA invertase Pin-like site-specific DNA recombinase